MRDRTYRLAVVLACATLVAHGAALAQGASGGDASPIHYRTCALGIVDVEARQIIIPYGSSPHDNPYFIGLTEVCETGGFDGTNVYFYPLPEQVRAKNNGNGENQFEPTGTYCGRFGVAAVATRQSDWLARLDDFTAGRQAQCEAGNWLFCGGVMFVARTEPIPPPDISCPVGR